MSGAETEAQSSSNVYPRLRSQRLNMIRMARKKGKRVNRESALHKTMVGNLMPASPRRHSRTTTSWRGLWHQSKPAGTFRSSRADHHRVFPPVLQPRRQLALARRGLDPLVCPAIAHRHLGEHRRRRVQPAALLLAGARDARLRGERVRAPASSPRSSAS
jgi:hypothetical protein